MYFNVSFQSIFFWKTSGSFQKILCPEISTCGIMKQRWEEKKIQISSQDKNHDIFLIVNQMWIEHATLVNGGNLKLRYV